MAETFNPEVASVIPVLNEAKSIIGCLNSLCNQSYPAKQHQIHVFDGGSTDNSWHIIETFINDRQGKEPTVHLHKNPGRYVAEARNLALALIPKSVEYFVEIIGHCSVESDHIEKLVLTMGQLQKSTDNNVGALGARVIPRQGELGLVESWVEAALLSPIARGKGQFDRFSGIQTTNTPAFCLHYREALDRVGGWDTSFITSQDSDLSMRMKKIGFQLYRTSEVKVQMSKRTSLRSWWKMGFRYGFWRTKLVKRHSNRINIRELLPWLGLLFTAVLYFTNSNYWFVPGAFYALVLGLEGVKSCVISQKLSHVYGVPLAILILHTSFSLGIFYGIFGKPQSFNDRETTNGNLN